MDPKLQFEDKHTQEVKLLATAGFLHPLLIALGLPILQIGTHYSNLKLNAMF